MYFHNKLKPSRFKLSYFLFTILSFTLLTVEANAQGLQKAKGVLELIKTEILGIVPIIAVIALIGLGIGYWKCKIIAASMPVLSWPQEFFPANLCTSHCWQ
jgi:hypothetical protein